MIPPHPRSTLFPYTTLFRSVFVNVLSNFFIGPVQKPPLGGGQNVYQVLEQMTYVKGRHTLKWGAEYRRWIALSSFLPRARGEWQYNTLSNLINDTVPIDFAKRGAGTEFFVGN